MEIAIWVVRTFGLGPGVEHIEDAIFLQFEFRSLMSTIRNAH